MLFRMVGAFARVKMMWHRLRPATREPRCGYLLLMRLDNLDLLARHLGQAGIAHLLMQMATRLSHALRPHDPVRMIAPGMFAIRVEAGSDAQAMRIARRLQERGQHPCHVVGRTVMPVLTGALIAQAAPGAGPVAGQSLIDEARDHLLKAGPDQAGQIVLYLHDPHRAAAAMPASVRDAVESGQIVAHFQPQICCHSGRVTGFEALARWQHPQRGLLMPAEFLPGMTDDDERALTRAMLSHAMEALRFWDGLGHDVPTVSINVSNRVLSDADFATTLLWDMDQRDIPPSRLVIEVLESVGPIASNAEARQNLAQLAAAGCHLDLDDFGTGYASLDAIRQFGIHRIKIDRSFVMGCDIDPAQQRMILGILALADNLGLETLAEGVETRHEHGFLAQIGCGHVQGYALARPMALDQTVTFLADTAARLRQMPDLGRRSA